MMGIAFSLIPAVMWPSVAYIVEERRLGTAYSVMTLIQQVGVAGMNWLIGRTNDTFGASVDNPMGHAPGMWIFSSWASWPCSSPSCCAARRPAPTPTAWRRSPPSTPTG